MKKTFFIAALSGVIGAIGLIDSALNHNPKEFSDLQLSNAEALADGEGDSNCRWLRVEDSHGCAFHVCVDRGNGDECTCGLTDFG